MRLPRHTAALAASLLHLSLSAAAAGPGPQEASRPSHLGAWSTSIHGLARPLGVAVGPAGRIHVAEAGAHRVRIFSRAGEELAAFGRRGGGEGELLEPSGVAVAPDGTVLVADTGNHRVVVFAPDGTFLRAWGGLGTAAGRFHTPWGIAADGERAAVADVRNRRVQVFDHRGRHLWAVTLTGPGEPCRPVGVALGPKEQGGGELLVADADRHRIDRYDPRGQHLGSLGGFGYFPGLLASPRGLDARDGRVYVADFENHRVQVFDQQGLGASGGAGRPLYTFGLHAIRPREGRGKLHYPSDVAVAPDRSFAVLCEPADDRVQVFLRAPGAQPQPDALRAGTGQASPHFGPRLAVDRSWMTTFEPETHRVLLHDLRLGEAVMISRFGGFGGRLGLFCRPGGMDLDMADRSLYVCDTGNRRLQHVVLEFDPTAAARQDFELARFVRALDFERLGPRVGGRDLEWTVEPLAVARDGGGDRIFVLDGANEGVVVLDRSLGVVGGFGGHGTAPGRFRRPTDLALSPDGERLYVVDAANARLQALTAEGEPLAVFGVGELDDPHGVVCAADGSLLVSDAGGCAVLRFSPTGELLARFGQPGIRRGCFLRPRGLALTGKGQLVVLDHANHRGLVLTTGGEFVNAFGPRLYTRPARKPQTWRAEDYAE